MDIVPVEGCDVSVHKHIHYLMRDVITLCLMLLDSVREHPALVRIRLLGLLDKQS